MQIRSITVSAYWDHEASVWVATSDDVPGLATEAATPEELEAKLLEMIPDLLAMNDDIAEDNIPEIPLYILSEQRSKVRLHR